MAELPPAAMAAVLAFYQAGPKPGSRRLAAALRALADHKQAPITLGQPIDHWSPDDRTRRELRNLAEELDRNA